MADTYKIVTRANGALKEALDAMIELNIHANAARDAGWSITFDVDEDGDITMSVVGGTRPWTKASESLEPA